MINSLKNFIIKKERN